jgi:hypothetical protein
MTQQLQRPGTILSQGNNTPIVCKFSKGQTVISQQCQSKIAAAPITANKGCILSIFHFSLIFVMGKSVFFS